MRTKDYAKQYMDAIGATLTKGIHPTLAVLSDAWHHTKDGVNQDIAETNSVHATVLHFYHTCDTMVDGQTELNNGTDADIFYSSIDSKIDDNEGDAFYDDMFDKDNEY
eukprot:13707195-Ditylum_brightwellii.AAC.1